MLARNEAYSSDTKLPILPGAWVLGMAVGRSDQQVLDGLKRFDIPTYYPMVMEMRKVPKRQLSRLQRESGVEIMKPQSSPMFPRYVFMNLDGHINQFELHDVFKRVGIGGMAYHNGRLVCVRDAEIDRLKGRENNGLIPGETATRVLFDIGDRVMVTAGPFASFPAIVESSLDVPIEELDPATRIKVAVNIFGRATRVDMEVWQVAKQS